MIATIIWVTFDFVGYHQWLEAPDDLAVLRSKHRHKFKCKVWIQVFHDNREIEFFSLQKECRIHVSKEIDLYDVGSCEMAADKILKALRRDYTGRFIAVEVSEDGENGAIVSYGFTIQPAKLPGC